MYKIGDTLKRIDENNPCFIIGYIYHIATQRQQDKKFVIFDENSEPHYYDDKQIDLYFEKQDNSINNGGSTSYYKFEEDWKECQDIIEHRDMNFSQGNIFKSAFCFNIGRHNATDYTRELNKIIYFANRELERMEKENLF